MASYVDVVKYGYNARIRGFPGSLDAQKNYYLEHGLVADATLVYNNNNGFLMLSLDFVTVVDPLCGRDYGDQLRIEGWDYHISLGNVDEPPAHVFNTWDRKRIHLKFYAILDKCTAWLSQEENEAELVELIKTYAVGRFRFPYGSHVSL